MIQIDWRPGDRKLRQFAIASLIGFPLIGFVLTRLLPPGVLAPSSTILLTAAALGAVVCLAGLIHPPVIRPVYVVMTAVALPIGLALGFVLMPLIYFGLFVPIGLALRVFGKDPMHRALGRAGSYWIKRPPTPAPATYFRQY